jgi:ribosomal protein L40E
MIEFNCPFCKAGIKFDDEFAGKSAKCTACSRSLTVPSPVAAAVSDALPPAETLERETLFSIIQNTFLVIALVVAQSFVGYLPGGDIRILGITIGECARLGLAVGIIFLMIRLLKPLQKAVPYYIGLALRVRGTLAAQSELKSQITTSATYFILAAYVAIFYWGILPSVVIVPGAPDRLIQLIQLAVAVIGIFFIVKFAFSLRPLLAKATAKITDRAMEATQRVDSKNCQSCGARIPLQARFCSSCGKAG